MMFNLTSASILASAYYEGGVKIEIAVKRARRLSITANVLTFWALSGLLLVAFDFTWQAVFYAFVSFMNPIVWLTMRIVQRIPF